MPRFIIHHRHAPHECGIAFAAFRGHDSPLRRGKALASCASGEHAVWWTVDAPTKREALDLFPYFVAQRSMATEVGEVVIP